MTQDEKWQEKYLRLKQYIHDHRQLPDKKKLENRELLNWWKYNKKQAKAGKLTEVRTLLLRELSGMRLQKDDKKSLF